MERRGGREGKPHTTLGMEDHAAAAAIRKLWYIYTMEYYSAIKKTTFESVLMRWMKLGAYYTE